jgi:hypothetical protein
MISPRYRTIKAVDDVSFCVRRHQAGELLGDAPAGLGHPEVLGELVDVDHAGLVHGHRCYPCGLLSMQVVTSPPTHVVKYRPL